MADIPAKAEIGVTTGPIRGSRKVHVGPFGVAMREIDLDPSAGEPPVLLKRHFDEWGELYLDIDPDSRTRSPAAVKVPSGAFQDIYDAWAGEFPYDPARVRAPVLPIAADK